MLVSLADGSVRVLRSLGEHHTISMDLSPDGRWIVYDQQTGPGTEHRDIFLLPTDGGQETHLVADPADDWAPYWTPDGDSILFVSDRSGTVGLWLLPLEDRQPQGTPHPVKLGMGQGFRPMGITRAWEYYYSAGGGAAEVYVAALDFETGRVQQPPQKVSQRFSGSNTTPFWSPDGKRLAFLSARDVSSKPGGARTYVVIRSTETGEERDLSPRIGGLLYPMGWAAPRWHPDGRSILVHGASGDSMLSLIDAESGEEHPIRDRDSRQIQGFWPVFAQQGRELLYVTFEKNTIRAHDLATGTETTLYSGAGYIYRLALSPDGKQLAFFEGDDALHPGRLEVIPRRGGEPRVVLELPQGERFSWDPGLAWTRDGRLLLFGRGEEPVELWRVTAAGGDAERVMTFPKGRIRNVSLHPDGRRMAYSLETQGSGGIWALRGFLSDGDDSRSD